MGIKVQQTHALISTLIHGLVAFDKQLGEWGPHDSPRRGLQFLADLTAEQAFFSRWEKRPLPCSTDALIPDPHTGANHNKPLILSSHHISTNWR